MKVKTTIDSYRNLFYTFGLLTILYILEHFEEKENFEECTKIIEAIRTEERRLNTTFYTKVTKECIADIIESYKKFGLTGYNIYNHAEYYKNEILNTIE